MPSASRGRRRYGLSAEIYGKPTSSILGAVAISMRCRSAFLCQQAPSGLPVVTNSSSRSSMARRATTSHPSRTLRRTLPKRHGKVPELNGLQYGCSK